jgi:membrane fusion protein
LSADDLEPRRATLVVLAVIVVVVIYLLFGVSVSSREFVPGRVIYSGRVSHITSPIDGYVETTYVEAGQAVRTGDRLALIRHSRHISEDGLDFAAISGNIRRRTALSQDKEASQRELLAIEQAQLLNKVRMLDLEEKTLRGQIALSQRSLALQEKNVERARAMVAQGFFSPVVEEEKEIAVVEIQLRIQELEKSLVNNDAQRSEAVSQVRANKFKSDQLRSESSTERETLNYQLGDLGLKTTAVLVAMSDGIIDGISVKTGDSVKEGQRLGAVRSGSGEFKLELDVPSSAAGFVRVGQRIDVRYEAFPYLKYGFGSGEIVSIATTSGKATQDLEKKTDPYFRAVAVSSLPPRLSWDLAYVVRDQMAVQVEIVIENKHLYEWIFDPLIAARRFFSADERVAKPALPGTLLPGGQ